MSLRKRSSESICSNSYGEESGSRASPLRLHEFTFTRDMRATTAGSAVMLTCSDIAIWTDALLKYDQALRALSSERSLGSKLFDLDRWISEAYPELLANRTPMFITRSELESIMQWKLSRGKDRPMLMSLIRQNSPAAVEITSREAFQLVEAGSSMEGLKKLTELKGVGPATASAIMTPIFPDKFVFMSDEVLEASTNKKRDYTMKSYETTLRVMKELQRSLREIEKGDDWNLDKLGKAMWAAGTLSVIKNPVSESSTPAAENCKKRKR
jgi:hypothetical protein